MDLPHPEHMAAGAAQKSPPRQPLYFACGERRLFGWFHAAASDKTRNCAVVICNPLGYEYTHSHRSLRHLAENLAEAGIAALRFDYDGSGDSPGDDFAPYRVACWLEDIRAAISTLRELSGCTEICLIGVRMGATLAAAVACESDVARLVLWNPCNGNAYVREMKALALSAASETNNELGFESAGFMLLHETAEHLKALSLRKLPYRSECDVLLLYRDDSESDTALENYLRERGVAVTQLSVPGYAEMMAEPQFTVVPAIAIEQIIGWLRARSSSAKSQIAQRAERSNEACTTQDGVELIESCHQFGPRNNLFGIVTRAAHEHATQSGNAKPAIVFFNAGSVHRVGPNRLYTILTRKLAALGFICFRFDLQGLGDSMLIANGRENHPYPATASADGKSALEFLKTRCGCSSFVLAGLCSGAHSAFHTGIELSDFDIREVILINPLTYRYFEGMTLSTTIHHKDVVYYKDSARKWASWLKLFSGKVDIGNLIRLGLAQIKVLARSKLDFLREKLFAHPTTQLSADLRALLSQRRLLSLFVASNEPGYVILASSAAYVTKKGMQSNRITLYSVPDGDHTFSRSSPRHDAIKKICSHIQNRYGQ